MSKQQALSSQNQRKVFWWIRLCRWLWKHPFPFLWSTILINAAINIGSTWLITPTNTIPNTSLIGRLVGWIGGHWLSTLLFATFSAILLLLTWLGSSCYVSILSLSNQSQMSARDRERMLKSLRFRYEQLLDQSLQGAVRIELGLASRPAAIHNALSLSLRLPEQAEQVLPAHTSIVDAYDLAQQELLILGEPGAGKSTLLLELAQHLVRQAEQSTVQPLPVVLPLSSWITKRLSLQDWLIEQFALLYDVPHKLSHNWIQTDLILPLLDGLDEMEASARVACIAAINTYHRERLHPLVVCSRVIEYDAAALHERLALHAAVVVQPLTREQIDTHLATIGKPLTALRKALKKNTSLQTLATTPLLLQILMLTYHGIPIRALSHKEGQVREQIWTDYVQQMVSRKGNNTHYPLEQTRIWLSWLAREMRLRNQTIFSLEQLQPDWLSKGRRAIYHWNVGLFVGLFVGLLSGLVVEVLFGLVVEVFPRLVVEVLSGLVIGLFSGLVVGRNTTIEPAEALIWSRKGKGIRYGLLVGLIVELLSWLFFGQLNVLFGLFVGLFAGLFAGLIAGLIAGLSGAQFTERLMLSPNEGMRRSMKNGLLAGLLIGPSVGLFSGLFTFILVWSLDGRSNWPHDMTFGLFFGLHIAIAFGLFFGLLFGLQAALQHYTLRFWIWRSHLFPWKAVPFLEDATARILLRHVGGGYSFTHRLLLDYFADLDITTPSPSTDAHLVQQPPLL